MKSLIGAVPAEWAAVIFDADSSVVLAEVGPQQLCHRLRAWIPNAQAVPRRGVHAAPGSKANPSAGEEEVFVMGNDYGHIYLRRESTGITLLSQSLPRPVSALALCAELRSALRTIGPSL